VIHIAIHIGYGVGGGSCATALFAATCCEKQSTNDKHWVNPNSVFVFHFNLIKM
jgi:hypothetical protein